MDRPQINPFAAYLIGWTEQSDPSGFTLSDFTLTDLGRLRDLGPKFSKIKLSELLDAVKVLRPR